MLLKRFLFLGALVLLFIVAFIGYFELSHAQMEERFRQERIKFGVEGSVLTSSEPASPPASTPSPAATSTPMGSTAATANPTSAATPAGDTNSLIGPVPPAGPGTDVSATPPTPAPGSAPADTSAAPAAAPATTDMNSAPAPATTSDTNAAPAPAAAPADTNAAPMPAPSTMYVPRGNTSPFQRVDYRPGEILIAQAQTGGPAPATVAPEATNAPSLEEEPSTISTPSLSSKLTPASTTNPGTVHASATPAPAGAMTERPAAGESSVIVLLYHQFVPAGVAVPEKLQWTLNQDVFESEMKYIHDNGYHVVPISDVLKFIKREITLPPGSVAITIDDGYKSAMVYAAPILKKYGYPWTFFIYPDFVTVAEGRGAVSWNDLLELQKEGVDIESHSMTHPTLTKKRQKFQGHMQDLTPDEYAQFLETETAGSKAELEQKMGKTINCFAYPYGAYNKEVEAAAVAAGYEAIFTVADNPVHSTTSLKSIGRYTITRNVVRNFAAYLHQSALGLTKAEPEPGDTITNPRPVITAVLAPMGDGHLDPNSIETDVRDFGEVRHDFDPQTNTVRLYLPRDLISTPVLVNLRVKDATTGQILVANWHFNYEPGANAPHAPLTPEPKSPTAAPTMTSTTSTPAPAKSAPMSTPVEATANGVTSGATNAPTAATPAPAAKTPTAVPAKAPVASKTTTD